MATWESPAVKLVLFSCSAGSTDTGKPSCWPFMLSQGKRMYLMRSLMPCESSCVSSGPMLLLMTSMSTGSGRLNSAVTMTAPEALRGLRQGRGCRRGSRMK